MDFSWISNPGIWAALLTLTALEIVLGIDNLIFISITADRLPKHQQALARRLGLSLAVIMRLALLASISWIASLTYSVIEVAGNSFSWRDFILIGGGIFLLYKGTVEIHELIEGSHSQVTAGKAVQITLTSALVSIMMLDIVFSLDSVITAVGMANNFWVMAAAIVIAVIIMIVASGPVSSFINRHQTVKMLALAFLILIGVVLIADGFGMHVPKGIIYAAIAFSIFVETLNSMARRKGGGH